MFRLKIILIALGGFLAYTGYNEYVVGNTASEEPSEVYVSSLEAGEAVENNHLLLREHIAVYSYCIFSYETDRMETEDMPADSAKVDYCYYPLISLGHPFNLQVQELLNEHGENLTDDMVPPFSNPAVLVKSKRFKTVGEIPMEWRMEESLQGLVINRINSLDPEEKALLAETFPGTDFESVLIVEEGRMPKSASAAFGMGVGGVLLALLGVASFFFGGNKRAA